MMNNNFSRLTSFIQEYIYKEGWQELRDVQIETINAILDTNHDVLIASPTASGKTEATLFPIITKMVEKPVKGIATIYISPLKALINDQFIRLEDILENGKISVFRWHGDVNSYQKQKALTTDNIILQITPESLEALLLRHYNEIPQLFKNLQFIIIDEVHYFLESVRGIQMMALIERLEKIIKKTIRRIGLSATIGNLDAAGKFISNDEEIIIIKNKPEKTKIRLLMVYDYITDEQAEFNYYLDIYKQINGKKCIVFANSKKQVEQTAQHLKEINEQYRGNNYILVHHGSISKALRDEVELKMKKQDGPITAVATMTLELGIDLGKLERVIQIDAPPSISSMVQRLGRTGRTNGIKEMCFIFNKEETVSETEFYKKFSWNFLISVAMVDLYLKEQYLEPIKTNRLPYSVLVQQTLSYLGSNPGIRAKDLAQTLLKISVFKDISKADYLLILKKMLTCELIEKDSDDSLYLGSNGEKLLNNYDFYSVFASSEDYEVINNNKVIGSVAKKLPLGARFSLAGMTWEVSNIHRTRKIIEVIPSKGLATNSWNSKGLFIVDTKVMKHLRNILTSCHNYRFLNEQAQMVYHNDCQLFSTIPFINKIFVQISNNEYLIFPFIGTKSFLTLYYILKNEFIDVMIYFETFIPLFISVKVSNIKVLIDYLTKLISQDNIDFKVYEMFINKEKYDEYLPEQLIKKAYQIYYLDVLELQKELRKLL